MKQRLKNPASGNPDFEKTAIRVSAFSIIGNAILVIFKMFAGIVAHSAAMISDAVHSASDVLSSIIVIIGVKLSTREADPEHPYGHERMECVAAILLAGVLLATGLVIGWQGIQKITKPEELQVPGVLALIAAVVSIGVKEAMYRYTRKAAKQIQAGDGEQ